MITPCIKKPAPDYGESEELWVSNVRYRVPHDVIFCEECDVCMACDRGGECFDGEAHVWPDGWKLLVRRLS